MERMALWILVVSTPLALGVFFSAEFGAGPAYAATSGERPALDGKKIFLAEKCELCHAVSTVGIEAKTTSEKLLGPDLVGIGESRETSWLVRWLRKEETIDGEKHKKGFKGSDEELQALVDWLLEQKKAE